MLAHALIQAMRENAWLDDQGLWHAPDYYLIEVDPPLAESLTASPGALDDLGEILKKSAWEAGMDIRERPVVKVSAAPNRPPGEVAVFARYSLADLSQTASMEPAAQAMPNDPPQTFENRLPPGAFLIVDGTHIFPLTQSLVNIGRLPDNHLVIPDPRVSRRHAQLRLIQSRFVLFDLDSTGGTALNGNLVHQSPLTPGDVISLSGVPLVYGQEDSPPDATQRINLNQRGSEADGRLARNAS
jgi:pSer/pThr/pTyr-binding forkhead associated (FHA) protein